jgi:hypothetical protein
MLMAIEQWRPYLQHNEFIIRTDQKSLVHLDDQRLATNWQHKAFTKLLGLQYKLCYCKGTENKAADAFSRRSHDSLTMVATITECQPAWLADVRASYASNPHAQALIQKLQTNPDNKQSFVMQDGILYFRNRIWLGGSPQL